jgi:hypothetical protein
MTQSKLSGDVKLMLGFFADVLYVKEVLCFEEFNAIMEAKYPSDLEDIFERLMRGEFNVYKRGEARPIGD